MAGDNPIQWLARRAPLPLVPVFCVVGMVALLLRDAAERVLPTR